MDAVYALVDLYSASESYREAITVLERALQQEDSDQLYYRLGDAYYELTETDEAIEQYVKNPKIVIINCVTILVVIIVKNSKVEM